MGEITAVTFITLSVLLVASIYGLYKLICIMYDHDYKHKDD